MSGLQRMIDVAAAEVGTVESPPGSNRQKYSERMGRPPEPWCDDFISDVADRAGLGDVIWRSSYVPSRLTRARQVGQASRTPSVGALACFDWDHDGVPDHIGLVIGVTDGGRTISTIEGNTSRGDRGSQGNGGGVWRRTRPASLVEAFIHPPYPEADMPLTEPEWTRLDRMLDAKIAAGANATRDAVLDTGYGKKGDGSPHTLGDLLGELLNGINVLVRRSDAGGVDPAALATAIVTQIGQQQAGALCDELAKRLVR